MLALVKHGRSHGLLGLLPGWRRIYHLLALNEYIINPSTSSPLNPSHRVIMTSYSQPLELLDLLLLTGQRLSYIILLDKLALTALHVPAHVS